MKRHTLAAALVSTLLAPSTGYGYNGATHALLTYSAYNQSNLAASGANSVQQRLGLDRLDATLPLEAPNTYPDGTDGYYDNQSVDPPTLRSLFYPRAIQKEERDVFKQLLIKKYFTGPNNSTDETVFQTTIAAWIMRGAVREDDDGFPILNGLGNILLDDNRDVDPWGEIIRVLNHFYDPVNDRALTVGVALGAKATDWSLGLTNAVNYPDVENTFRREHFSLRDFYNNLYDALTLERDRNADGSRDASEREFDSYERRFRMATAMKSLGHVVHLLQDMAQPQHTRNDGHADYINSVKKKFFEPFTELRVIGNSSNPSDSNFNVIRDFFGFAPDTDWFKPIVLTGATSTYPIPTFARAIEFFTTRVAGDTNSTIPNRMGMADFSNRNFFSVGTLPITNSYPYPSADTSTFTTIQLGDAPVVGNQPTTSFYYAQSVQDPLSPGFVDTLPVFAGGKVPLASYSLLSDLNDLTGSATSAATLDIFNYEVMADVNLPRAIGYSAGLINFALRGKLEITPLTSGVFAVLDQGTPHSVDTSGYPHPTAAPTQIFGFQMVRLKLRNMTPAITEPTTGTVFPQGTGSSNNSASIVAVARYHRNTCYQPSLLGERVQDLNGIAEPTCSAGQVVRTAYQEVSVSAPLNVTTGELDNLSSGIEKDFDFTNDAIPVNATDLFIQVVYRGPLGSEASSIAVGNLDVSEPTFAGYWNNTDYYWNGTAWQAPPPAHPKAPAISFNGCGGNAPTYQWFYNFTGSAGNVALGSPPTSPTIIRLAYVVAPKSAGNYILQGTPIMDGTVANAPKEYGTSKGEIIQASQESIAASVLTAPAVNCAASPPGTTPYWCFDVIQRRRGTIFGAAAVPIFYNSAGSTVTNYQDVDVNGQVPLTNAVVRTGGTNKFNASGALQTCP